MFVRVANIIEEGKLGGPQVRIAHVAAALQHRVETIIVMPDDNSSEFREQCDALGVKYVTFRMSRITKEWKVALRYIFFSVFEIWRLSTYLRLGNCDLVHVSGGSWQYKGVIAGRLTGKTVLWHLNDTSMPWVLRRLFVAFSRYADGYIFASERSKEYYGALVKADKPQFVIPAPVDTRRFDPGLLYQGDEELIKQWKGKTVIGTVANINPIKGLDVFIRAAALLNEQSDNLVFVIIGSLFKTQKRYAESLHQLCKSLPADNVVFVGGRADVRPLLKRFDVYACSSQAESSPISVWEAMGMGKPVVSTDVGDVPLYVQDGYNGFIVNVGDAVALADRLSSLINDKYMSETFGRRAREIAVIQLDVELCAQRHLDAYVFMNGLERH